jgi:hypothetical protein
MNPALTADDLLPLVQKLSHDEQVRLAKLALRAAASSADEASVYRATPPPADEFSSDEEALAWEAEDWKEFDASR